MALKVFAGVNQANQQYENSFFRSFANTLSSLFEEQQREGILIGHPRSRDDEFLQMDCLLITANSIVIIDFKQRDNAIVHLPTEAEFLTGNWQSQDQRTGEFTTVRGGNARNPFEQVQKQSRRLSEICSQLSIDIPIRTSVIFDGNVTTSGNVPGKYLKWFSIADANNYVDVLFDAVNVQTDKPLSNLTQLLSRFECTEYRDVVPLRLSELQDIQDLASLSIARQKANDDAEKALIAKAAAEQELTKNKALGVSLEESQRKLAIATQQAERTQELARAALQDFDDKKNTLETARENRKTKELEKNTERIKFMRWGLGIAFLLVVGAIALAFFFSQFQAIQNQKNQGYLEGTSCIPVSDVEAYIDMNGVCVTMSVNSVFDRAGHVVLKTNVNENFQIFFTSPDLISTFDARQKYEGETLEIRGDIDEYEEMPQIKVYELSQIQVID